MKPAAATLLVSIVTGVCACASGAPMSLSRKARTTAPGLMASRFYTRRSGDGPARAPRDGRSCHGVPRWEGRAALEAVPGLRRLIFGGSESRGYRIHFVN